MRTLPTGLQDHLDSGVTTLCYCWKLTRKNGGVLGFTDHDRSLSFDGVTFEAETGLTASAFDGAAGLAVDNMDVIGALNSDAVREADIAAGLYDNADIEIYRVNWGDPAQRLLVRKGNLGEVTRGPVGFTAEARGLSHHLDQAVGRRYQYRCDADLGDARCTVDVATSAFKGVGSVASAIDGRAFTASGLDSFENGWFTRGRLTWTSGPNAGASGEVKLHAKGTTVSLELWRPMGLPVSAGDGFDVFAGCDKRFETCRDKFSNVPNFRGFHLMPGNDFAQSYPNRGENNDGGKRG